VDAGHCSSGGWRGPHPVTWLGAGGAGCDMRYLLVHVPLSQYYGYLGTLSASSCLLERILKWPYL